MAIATKPSLPRQIYLDPPAGLSHDEIQRRWKNGEHEGFGMSIHPIPGRETQWIAEVEIDSL